MNLKIPRRLTFALLLLIVRIARSKLSPQSHHQAIQSTLYPSLVDPTFCRTVPGLTKHQIELCYQQPDATLQALQGLNQAVKECQHQFQGYRWNCSSLSTKGRNPYISAMFQRGFKETAFAYAISSAGVAISVAKACSAGSILNCGCDSKVYKMRNLRSTATTTWKWGGCSHNLRYGIKFSKLFLDSREQAEDIHSMVNLHNNQVGRMVVSNNMQLKCKCHGMSGSCQLKTCWRAVTDFQVVGKILKDKFQSAVVVDQSNLGSKYSRQSNIVNQKSKKRQIRVKLTPRKNKYKRDLSYDLLYYQKSPNFCEKDALLDIPGTIGRVCNRTTTSPNSCSALCCGRGYNLVKQRKTEMCNCKFYWCCEVKCKVCNVEEWISVCK
ncbi:protein Wnt-10a [Cylas formicarius]|uniref:protein Wnt-10a n=1 Tax=Cylas formicarius TaxID=197179 RepID=UPI002958853B|nr:protein Wnt-10a [Cylas formicarius]